MKRPRTSQQAYYTKSPVAPKTVMWALCYKLPLEGVALSVGLGENPPPNVMPTMPLKFQKMFDPGTGILVGVWFDSTMEITDVLQVLNDEG